jgi:hypothetical protein
MRITLKAYAAAFKSLFFIQHSGGESRILFNRTDNSCENFLYIALQSDIFPLDVYSYKRLEQLSDNIELIAYKLGGECSVLLPL